MIEYIIRDTEHGKEQRGEAEAVFLLSADEQVEGQENTKAHGCVYYGPDRAHNMVGAFADAMLKREARVLRQIYIQLYNLSNIDREFARKMVKLSFDDMTHLFDELGEAGKAVGPAADDAAHQFDELSKAGKEKPASDPDLLELMRDAGMLDEGESGDG